MQRVLGVAFANPDHSFTLNELLAHAGGDNGGGQRQIERLLAAGVLQEGPRRARQRCIKVNTEFFLYPELRGIDMTAAMLEEVELTSGPPFV